MNADYVENIIRDIDKQSYKCILVDGAWGIGKSYALQSLLKIQTNSIINRSLKKKQKVSSTKQ